MVTLSATNFKCELIPGDSFVEIIIPIQNSVSWLNMCEFLLSPQTYRIDKVSLKVPGHVQYR